MKSIRELIVLAVAGYFGQRTVETVRGAPGASRLIMGLGWAGPIEGLALADLLDQTVKA